ncbi:MAG: PilZ domain-containing protein [Candidatus Omnitrophica bacterium]|nr:PilZ domain-containing protein [Candidatus Omnitrophota bacterium]
MSLDMDNLVRDKRADLRVPENLRIFWSTESGNISGLGRVRNISTSGMLLETNGNPVFSDGDPLVFNPSLSADNFIPKVGRVVWQKPRPFALGRSWCGIAFTDQDATMLDHLRQRVEIGVGRLVKARRAAQGTRWAAAVLIVVMVIFSVHLLGDIFQDLAASNTQLSHVTTKQAFLYQKSVARITTLEGEVAQAKAMYQESQLNLQSVTSELGTTKNLLSDTEKMLTDAKVELQAIKDLNTKYQTKIADLEDKNAKLSQEMRVLQDRLTFYEGNVKNSEEARDWLLMYRNRVHLVKSRIKKFKQEAQEVRKSAQKEADRARILLGNKGYFVKDGQRVVVDQEKYNSVTHDVAKPNVKVDVQVFN